MMQLQRFRELVEAYGGDPRRWPAAERAPAAALLAGSPEAQALLAEAGALDRLLDRTPPLSPPILNAERLIARVTGAVQERPIAHSIGAIQPPTRGLWLRAAGLAAAAVIGFMVGWTELGTSDATAASGSSLDFAGDLSW